MEHSRPVDVYDTGYDAQRSSSNSQSIKAYCRRTTSADTLAEIRY